MKKALLLILTVWFLAPSPGSASLAVGLSGRILLDVERNGEAWYIWPEDNKRYYLGRPTDAFTIMREKGLGISEADFARLRPGEGHVTEKVMAKRLSGRILLQVEKNGEAWYIDPVGLEAHFLGRPADAFDIMRRLGLGISRENLAMIHKPGASESIDGYSRYEHRDIDTKSGRYRIDVVEIDLANPDLRVFTAAASPFPSRTDGVPDNRRFGAQSLGRFVLEHKAFAGINGTYFDTGAGRPNYYFFPVWDSLSGRLVNEDQLKFWTTGPIMAFGEDNKFYYFKDSREFGSVAAFEEKHQTKLQAAIGNRPRLIENGMNLLIDWDIEDRQRDIKAVRNALAYKDNKIYLVVARNATVPDLADIMQAMEMQYALNLDGGHSAALWYNDEYMVKPGRSIPNALLFGLK